MSKYTKKEWIVTEEKNTLFGNGYLLWNKRGMKIEFSKANARLISAAPELLEACKWAYNALKPFSKDPAEKSGIKLLEQAIKKAEGK